MPCCKRIWENVVSKTVFRYLYHVPFRRYPSLSYRRVSKSSKNLQKSCFWPQFLVEADTPNFGRRPTFSYLAHFIAYGKFWLLSCVRWAELRRWVSKKERRKKGHGKNIRPTTMPGGLIREEAKPAACQMPWLRLTANYGTHTMSGTCTSL